MGAPRRGESTGPGIYSKISNNPKNRNGLQHEIRNHSLAVTGMPLCGRQKARPMWRPCFVQRTSDRGNQTYLDLRKSHARHHRRQRLWRDLRRKELCHLVFFIFVAFSSLSLGVHAACEMGWIHRHWLRALSGEFWTPSI
jgi:hypothetical protein